MHSGVGATRAGDMHRLAFDLADDLFERALDGGWPRVDLLAVEVSPVISQPNLYAPHYVAPPVMAASLPSGRLSFRPTRIWLVLNIQNSTSGIRPRPWLEHRQTLPAQWTILRRIRHDL